MSGIRRSDEEDVSYEFDNEESEDESEILEESPCGRYLKRREQVDQKDVPGIKNTFLAMDTEEGVEVVWNEIQFSERKNYKSQERKIQLVFENLIHLQHPNIIKFHRYWTDTYNDRPRVIFITEYMSSGSLKQFLKRTKHNVKKLSVACWIKWCRQILSALSYLHSCCPPIVHGNLTCDTIFIQHNGLLKIGTVAPDMMLRHVKTCRNQERNAHFVTPDQTTGSIGPKIDIYSFGVCALQMASLDLPINGDHIVTKEDILKNTETLEDRQQMDFILKCFSSDPDEVPSARELLFHPLLFEVHSLKLLVSHFIVHMISEANILEIVSEYSEKFTPNTVIAAKYSPELNKEVKIMTVADINLPDKLEKFVEDVKNGIYPLTAYKIKVPPPPISRASSPELTESMKSPTPELMDTEERHIVNMMCNVRPNDSDLMMTILLRLEDKMNRQLTCPVSKMDSSSSLSQELVYYGFINEEDKDKVQMLIEVALNGGLSDDNEEDNSSNVLPNNNRSIPYVIRIS